jgi:hypothetical protein
MNISVKTSAAIALALATVTLPSVANATVTVATIRTGTAPVGGVDPNWFINGGAAYVPTDVHDNWINGTNGNSSADGARWITPNLNGNISVRAAAGMIYSTTFTLDNIENLSTASLSGDFWADNRVLSIILNGDNIFDNFSSGSQFALGGNGTLSNVGGGAFVYGVNNLTFILQNDPGGRPGIDNDNPSGLRALLQVTAAVPEPGTWLLMLMGFGFVGFQMRRRQKTQVRFQFA